MVTFIVLFSATQTFGGLVGSSFFSTYQQHRTQNYQVEIIKDLEQADPLVAQRLSTYQRSASVTTTDPALQTAQSMHSLNQVVTREAQVRAYNDVIALNGILLSHYSCGVVLILHEVNIYNVEELAVLNGFFIDEIEIEIDICQMIKTNRNKLHLKQLRSI